MHTRTVEKLATPRRELAPPLEEDEEQDSERDVPLRQIENNISALLRGDIAVARVPGNFLQIIGMYSFYTKLIHFFFV